MSDNLPRLPAQKPAPGPTTPTLEELADLIPDAEAATLLRCTTRTLSRYEKRPNGLGYTMLGGKKYRRLSGIREFLAQLEVKPNPTKKTRARGRQSTPRRRVRGRRMPSATNEASSEV